MNTFKIGASLTGYAYETAPGTQIRAGQTSGSADDSAESEDLANPGTLGTLARGAAK